jgi:hypothetical protein
VASRTPFFRTVWTDDSFRNHHTASIRSTKDEMISLGPSACGSEYCRIHTRDPAYGRWTAFNASYLRYEHIPNDPAHADNGETWVVTAERHGPFRG